MPLLRNYAWKLCASRDCADDLAQTALLKAWSSRASFTAGTNLRAWVFTILRNEIYSHFRHESVEARWLCRCDKREVEGVAEPGAPDDRLAIGDAMRALDRIVSPMQRDTIIAVFLDGATYERVAALHKCPVGTAKSRANRGILKLRAWSNGMHGRTSPSPPLLP